MMNSVSKKPRRYKESKRREVLAHFQACLTQEIRGFLETRRARQIFVSAFSNRLDVAIAMPGAVFKNSHQKFDTRRINIIYEVRP
jgi:hypothetical protein